MSSTSKKLVKSTSAVSLMTLLSRILGLVRDMAFSYALGAAGGLDAFIVALKIPNFMRRLFAEGAFSQAFVPVLSEYRAQRELKDVKRFVGHMAGTLGLALLVVVAIAEIAAPLLILVFAPGFHDEPHRYDLAVHMVRLTFPYLLLISITALCGAVLNTYNRFAVPAFTPVLFNVALIVAALWGARFFAHPVYALAWGVCAAGVLQLGFQLPFIKRLGLLGRLRFGWRDAGVTRVLKLMAPALFGVSVAQISVLIDTLFASFLPVGSISWLYYSDRLIYFPMGVFGVALATVVLPHLSRTVAQNAREDYSASMNWALRSVLFVGIPAAIGIGFLAGPLLTTLFHYGKFDDFDVIMSRKSLIAYAVGLPAFMLIKVLASGFYARQNIKTPVKIAAVAMGVNICLNFALIFPLKHAGLALATSLSSWLNASLLFFWLLRYKLIKLTPGWGVFFIRLVLGSCVLALLLWFAPDLNRWLSNGWAWRLGHLLAFVSGGVVIYFVMLALLGVRLKDFRM